MIFANGAKFEGEFKDGSVEGAGFMTESNGLRVDGMWKNGKCEGFAV